jgi:nucleotide sugar dehydrogenase
MTTQLEQCPPPGQTKTLSLSPLRNVGLPPLTLLSKEREIADSQVIMSRNFPSNIAVLGQGYVGLPLAVAFSQSGLAVVGIDTDQGLVDGLCSGTSHIDDVSSATLSDAIAGGLSFTSDVTAMTTCEAVIVCVPTPLTEAGQPNFEYLSRAADSVTSLVKKGTLVVLESTSSPGTTEKFFLAELSRRLGQVGRDFFLAFSPERIDPGNDKFNLSNTPRVVGGVTEACAALASQVYGTLGVPVHLVSGPREAEMAKLLENTYRHVNIALVNELARICHDLDIDVWEVIEAAGTKPFGFEKFTPGPGVGGHCIPVDPEYLNSHVKTTLDHPFEFIELASRINNRMPVYVADRCVQALGGEPHIDKRSVLLLGITYKPNVSDLRGSPAAAIARILMKRGAEVRFHDPFIADWDLGEWRLSSQENLAIAVKEADLTVLLQNHSGYDIELLASRACRFLDTRGVASDHSLRL